ncbi:hypothetical protein [Paraburkholderia sp. C35]|uniref:hypothetical protein n=1 Tax=Paraburkholderia sp. C35 TaxID=2126993 RepID=UPI000D690CF4|nr:hypothetical protein [Paraburkholderia sp. C35]
MPVDRRFARRQALLACAIVRNVAFYRAGFETEDGRGRLKDDSQMGRTINSNFVDIAVLEWCKVFADWHARHHWRRLVRDSQARTGFRTALFAVLGLDEAGWEHYLTVVKTYRDRFVAHLDDDDTMDIPSLDPVLASTFFFYGQLWELAPDGALDGRFQDDLQAYYEASHRQACAYRATYDE